METSDLDLIDRRTARVRERLTSALAFAGAAVVAALAVSELRRYMVVVAAGAACWAGIEMLRLRFAADDATTAIDALVLAGSRDPRCERRRAELRSTRVQHATARSLRMTCAQAHRMNRTATWLVDPRAVRAVEPDLQELADLFDHDAGRLPAEAVVRTRLLVSPSSSPLYAIHLNRAEEHHAILQAERMIANCRADLELEAVLHGGSSSPRDVPAHAQDDDAGRAENQP